jgi:2-keto-4-pentenoate hydratase/2-oxohepta-3-ene-1,7-dioic acid hydratase in catechol pathway
MKSKAAQKTLLKEETIEFGPVVTRPERIIWVGLNYRQHLAI